MHKKTNQWLWLLAFVLTLLLAVYQRLSGPTYPLKGKQAVHGTTIQYKFLRSWTSGQALPVSLAAAGEGLLFRLHHTRFPFAADEKWTVIDMKKRNGTVAAEIPGEPAAGKVAYKVEVIAPDGRVLWLPDGPAVVARFKGEVPTALLIFHVIFMFAAMLLAFRTGLEALRCDGRWQKLVLWTLVVTFFGGLILGPLVQKYAFGAFWTGFPLGGDLTDSKTLFVVLFWLAAFFMRKKSRCWPLAATVLMVAVYLIPHSMLGSELNYQTGKIETAKEVQGSTPKIK